MTSKFKFTSPKIYLKTIIIILLFCVFGTLFTFVFDPDPNPQAPAIAWRYIVFWIITLDIPALVVFIYPEIK